MFKQLFQSEQKGFGRFIFLHAVLLILFLLYSISFSFCSYKGGFTVTNPEANEYFGVRFWLMLLYPVILLSFLIYDFIVIFKVGLRYVLPSIAFGIVFFVIFLYTISWPLIKFPTKGYSDYIRSNVDINKIHHWLVNYEIPDNETQHGIIYENNWPECIKTLHPSRGVFIGECEGIKYIRIYHAVDWELSLGLCVMEEAIDVPEYEGGYRIDLQEKAFVWTDF